MRISVIIMFICLFSVMIFSCHSQEKWKDIKYSETKICKSIGTECTTDHQGEHELQKCKVYFEEDTLVVQFLAELPAYWGSMEIKIYNGKFQSQFSGIPFTSEEVLFETIDQELTLGKMKYNVNDTLCGYCNIIFKEVYLTPSGPGNTFYFKGMINEIVRDKDFDPFDEKNFMAFDLPTAIREIGEPIDEGTFNTDSLSEFRASLLNYLPASQDILVQELTWDISDMREISDGGIERLTIWYVQKKNATWLPITFLKWNAEMEF